MSKDKTNLLPCPFCDGEPVGYNNADDPSVPPIKTIRCRTIECQAAIVSFSQDEAIASWNRRDKSDAVDRLVEASWKAEQLLSDMIDKVGHQHHAVQRFSDTVDTLRSSLAAIKSSKESRP